jgi:hypothetical protein
MPAAIDPIVYATRDLEGSVAELAERLGVQPAPGGQHIGVGTRNYLLHLGGDAYLELIGPDPEQTPPVDRPMPFGISDLTSPRLAGFAVKCGDIPAAVEKAKAAGYDAGQVIEMQRERPDGVVLQWVLATRRNAGGDGLVPFLIDWKDSPHPSASTPQGCTLVSLRGEHPDPASVRRDLAAVDAELEVTQAPAVGLVATIATPKGTVELR